MGYIYTPPTSGRLIWCRSNIGNSSLASVGYTDLPATTGTNRVPIVLNVLGSPLVSNAADFNLSNVASGQIIVNVAGTYDISIRAGFRNATVNTNYVLEIVRYSAANALVEIIGYSDLQGLNGSTINVESTCTAVGSFAVGERIGFLFSSAGNGSLLSPTFKITATV